jgi:hypothetical protein
LNQTLNSSIKHFVRSELGCACADGVFETTDVEYSPRRFHGLPGDCLMAIGGRLLVLLIYTTHWQEVSRSLESLLNRGRELRDAGGFNRIRFVIAAVDNEVAEAVLREQFSALPARDDRTHLHIIAPEGLPAPMR